MKTQGALRLSSRLPHLFRGRAVPATAAYSCPHPVALLPPPPPPSLAGLGQVLSAFVKPKRELLQMSPVAAVTLGETSGWG